MWCWVCSLLYINEKELLPQLLNTIVGKTFLFKIGIRRENILNRHESYPVLKIVTDRNVIYECDPCLCSNVSWVIRKIVRLTIVVCLSIDRFMYISLQETEDTYFGMTPAKRIRAFNGDFAERNDQSSATSSLSSVTNKRMKLDKSGWSLLCVPRSAEAFLFAFSFIFIYLAYFVGFFNFAFSFSFISRI